MSQLSQRPVHIQIVYISSEPPTTPNYPQTLCVQDATVAQTQPDRGRGKTHTHTHLHTHTHIRAPLRCTTAATKCTSFFLLFISRTCEGAAEPKGHIDSASFHAATLGLPIFSFIFKDNVSFFLPLHSLVFPHFVFPSPTHTHTNSLHRSQVPP